MSPYYPSIDQDLARAKEILARGRMPDDFIYADTKEPVGGGGIYADDIYAAYKLLESFVAHIEYNHQQLDACHRNIEELEQFKEHAIALNKKAADEIERLRLPGPLTGLQHAKYLNPACGENGCQWLRAQEEIRLLNVQVRRYQHAIELLEKPDG